MPLAPGATFERYAIEALVGRGGMGEVYKAVDTRLHRPVALKVLRTDKDASGDVSSAGGVARLLREARAAAAFNHANSVAIYELGEAEGIPYIAMEFVVGSSLRAYTQDPHVTTETKVTWLIDAARALWAAHKAGLVHRDVKPGNIMVSDEGVVKVLDFGLAKAVTKKDPGGFQTLMGQVVGTPRYMAPEQLEGEPADARADQFGFGVTAYELLSGVYPGGPLAGTPRPIEEIAPSVPAELSRVVCKMMARKRTARFENMEEAAHALRQCLPAVRAVRVPPSGDRPKRSPTSEAPTEPRVGEQQQQQQQSGAVAIDVPFDMPLAKNGTTAPLPAAVGAEVARRVATAPMASRPPTMKTLPLAQAGPSIPPAPLAPRIEASAAIGVYPTTSSFPSGPVSGVYASERRPPNAPPRPSGSRAWVIVVITVAVCASAGGAIAAWLTR